MPRETSSTQPQIKEDPSFLQTIRNWLTPTDKVSDEEIEVQKLEPNNEITESPTEAPFSDRYSQLELRAEQTHEIDDIRSIIQNLEATDTDLLNLNKESLNRIFKVTFQALHGIDHDLSSNLELQNEVTNALNAGSEETLEQDKRTLEALKFAEQELLRQKVKHIVRLQILLQVYGIIDQVRKERSEKIESISQRLSQHEQALDRARRARKAIVGSQQRAKLGELQVEAELTQIHPQLLDAVHHAVALDVELIINSADILKAADLDTDLSEIGALKALPEIIVDRLGSTELKASKILELEKLEGTAVTELQNNIKDQVSTAIEGKAVVVKKNNPKAAPAKAKAPEQTSGPNTNELILEAKDILTHMGNSTEDAKLRMTDLINRIDQVPDGFVQWITINYPYMQSYMALLKHKDLSARSILRIMKSPNFAFNQTSVQSICNNPNTNNPVLLHLISQTLTVGNNIKFTQLNSIFGHRCADDEIWEHVSDIRVVRIYVLANQIKALFSYVNHHTKAEDQWQATFETIGKEYNTWPYWTERSGSRRYIPNDIYNVSPNKSDFDPQQTMLSAFKAWAETMVHLSQAPGRQIQMKAAEWIGSLPVDRENKFQINGILNGRANNQVTFEVSKLLIELFKNPKLDTKSIQEIISVLPDWEYHHMRLWIIHHRNTPQNTLKKHYEDPNLSEVEAKNLLKNPNLPSPGVHYAIQKLSNEDEILRALGHQNIGTLTLKDFSQCSLSSVASKASSLLQAA